MLFVSSPQSKIRAVKESSEGGLKKWNNNGQGANL